MLDAHTFSIPFIIVPKVNSRYGCDKSNSTYLTRNIVLVLKKSFVYLEKKNLHFKSLCGCFRLF